MVIDILEARQNVDSLVAGLASGTGVSMGTKEIIVYVKDYNSESEIRNRIGNNYQGFPIRVVISGNVTIFQWRPLLNMKTKTDKFQEILVHLDKMIEQCNSEYTKEAVEFQGELDLAVMNYSISVPDYEHMSKQNLENAVLFGKKCKCFK